ncbi:MAG: hypothetical protein Q4F11_06015 [Eubacteriales bacterium]|nr:hypothetical protein [Eubacteriales bacterium]
MAYADEEYYKNVYGGTSLPDGNIAKLLRDASRHIDTLTYNRIVGRGIGALTEFQQEVIRESVCRLAEFEYENEDMIQTVLQQYSINGTSMSFGASWNVYIQGGVAMKKSDYALLCQSGLCCRRL